MVFKMGGGGGLNYFRVHIHLRSRYSHHETKDWLPNLGCGARGGRGAIAEALFIVYTACTLSIIGYGAQAYGCPSPHLLHQLNVIQNKALRIINRDNYANLQKEV